MALATAASIIGLGVSAAQTVSSITEGNAAQDGIDAHKPQELRNPYRDTSINTTAADNATAANITNVATSVDAAQRGGSRAIAATIPRLNESSILLQNRISEDISKQEQRRDELIARGDEKIQNMQEVREREILAGLGQQLNTARHDTLSGVQGFVSSGLALASSLKGNSTNEEPRESASTVSSLTPTGAESRGFVSEASSLTPFGAQSFNTNPLFQNNL